MSYFHKLFNMLKFQVARQAHLHMFMCPAVCVGVFLNGNLITLDYCCVPCIII